jgi:peptidoglycan/xylan/chitin deacetylase (PgdA/CDA1 family)
MPVRALLVAVALAIPAVAAASVSDEGGGPRTPGRLAVERLARLGVSVYCGGRRGRLVALTFDDGPGPYTYSLLRVLRRARARATFFLVGSRVAYWPGAVREEARLGSIGDHTWSHARLAGVTGARLAAEIGRRRLLFRPPYGDRTPAEEALLRDRRMLEVLWDVDARDFAPGATPASALAHVRAEVRPGSIVLLHDGRPWTAALTRAVLAELRRRRLRPVTVPELLAHDPPRLVRDRSGRLRTSCR